MEFLSKDIVTIFHTHIGLSCTYACVSLSIVQHQLIGVSRYFLRVISYHISRKIFYYLSISARDITF